MKGRSFSIALVAVTLALCIVACPETSRENFRKHMVQQFPKPAAPVFKMANYFVSLPNRVNSTCFSRLTKTCPNNNGSILYHLLWLYCVLNQTGL